THRDMGPITRYRGPEVPKEPQIWQDPVPPVVAPLITDADVAALKAKLLESGLPIGRLVATAWAACANYRGTDKRGGSNRGRLRPAPQNEWDVNEPAILTSTLATLERVRQDFGKPVSIADVIVLGGCAAVERAARDAGFDITVPFTPGRTDATPQQTDVDSFAV